MVSARPTTICSSCSITRGTIIAFSAASLKRFRSSSICCLGSINTRMMLIRASDVVYLAFTGRFCAITPARGWGT